MQLMRFHRDRAGGNVSLAHPTRSPSRQSLQEIAMKRLLTPMAGFALAAGLSVVQAETVWNFATAYKDNNFHT